MSDVIYVSEHEPMKVIATLETENLAPMKCPDELLGRDPVCVRWHDPVHGKCVAWMPSSELVAAMAN